MDSILSNNWLNPIVSILRLCSIIEYGGSHFLIVLVALLNCCPCLLDILKSKRWTLVTGKRSERNADRFIANCLNQDSNSSCFFLDPQLEVLGKMNKCLQTSSLSLNEVYSKITFVQPISLDVTKSITDAANVHCLEEAVPLFLGTDFQQHYLQCQDHALLTTAQLNAASKVMYDYIYKIADSIEKRFPEIDFMLTNTAFLEPPLRNLQQPDMQAMLNRFGQKSGPVAFPLDRVIMQFRLYQNDSSIDIQFSACNKDPLVFWCQLYEEGDYKELASLALLLLSISPTSVLCKQGFSTMNYVKNEFRSLLKQENLNACMPFGMTSHSVHNFPFHTFLKSRKV